MRDNIHSFPLTPEVRYLRASTLVSTDADSALQEANKLIDEGYWHAYTLAGLIYERKGDYAGALFSYKLGIARIGAVESWLGLARLNLLGKGISKNYTEALRCYRVVCEDANHLVAWLMLGMMHRRGVGVDKDLGAARLHLGNAIKSGSIVAYREIAEIDFEQGKVVSGLINKVKCGVKALRAVIRDPSDMRLRNDWE